MMGVIVPMQETDQTLISSHLEGDRAAFDRLVVKYHRPIYQFLYRMLGTRERSEDLVQETFVRAFRSMGKFDGRSRFSTWLFSIAINRIRTHLGKKRPEVPLEHAGQIQSPETGDSWTRRHLNAALAELPEGYRNVVIMHDVLGMEHREIAEARGCSVGTSKSQLHKARAKLRGLLGRRGTVCTT